MQDHTLTCCWNHGETISDYPVSPSLPPLLANTNVPVPLVNPHPPLPSTHPHTHTLHTWMHTGMRGEWHNPPNAKTWAAWSALRSTADLMNGHSDAQTKLRLDFYYTVGSRVTQSTDRSRNQRWMPVSLSLSLSNTESLPEIHTPQNTPWGLTKKKKHAYKKSYSSLFMSTTRKLHLCRSVLWGPHESSRTRGMSQ